MVAEHVPARTTSTSPRHLRSAALMAAAVLLVTGVGIVWGPTAGVVGAVVAVLLVGPAVVRTRDGRMWWAAIGARAGFRLAQSRGWTVYVPADHAHAAPPGVLAASELIPHKGYAVISDAHEPRFHSVVIGVAPVGASSPDGIRLEPNRWADWLVGLATRDRLVGASATLQVRRGTGQDLQDAISALAMPDAPALARQVLAEAVAAAESAPAQFGAWVSLTWDVRGMRSTEALAMIDDCLPEMLAGLAAAGAQQPQPLSPTEVSALMARAFTPGRTDQCEWEGVGPANAHEFANRYEHGATTSLIWRETTPRELTTEALAELLREDQDVPLKRATLLLRPSGDKTEPVYAGLLFTASCPTDDPEALARTAAAVRATAARARVDLQPASGAMASSFAAGLGVGIVPTLLTVLPARLRGLL